MTDASEYRHKLTDAQKAMSEAQLARTLPEGTGIAVHHFPPFWDVVARAKGGRLDRLEFIVTDSSTDRKPVRVHGPTSREEAMRWAKSTADIWRMTHVMSIDDEIQLGY